MLEKKRKRKKKKTSPPPPPQPSFSLLPDEIAVNCLARIPRAYYPRFSIVSKSFRSLLSSKELYAARSHIGSTEQCLYVCLFNDQSPQWFTLWISPNRTLPNSTMKKKKKKKKTKTVGKSLAPIPSSEFASVSRCILVVGSEIYVIGEGWTLPSSSTVRILDCGTHTWRDAPSMIVPRKYALACFYHGKIYVMGGCACGDEPWAEVFDTNTQTWARLSDPGTEIRGFKFCLIKEMKGKIYFWNAYRKYAYDTRQDCWEHIAQSQVSTCLIDDDAGVNYSYIPKPACVMDDGVWYCISYGHFCSWSKNGRDWEAVKGLDSLEEMYRWNGGSSNNTNMLVSCGGKLLLMWEGYKKHNPSNRKKIWCGEITLETDDEGEVWGHVESIDVVQSVPTQCALLECLVVSV